MSKHSTAKNLFSRATQIGLPGFAFNRKSLIVLTISLLSVSFIGLWRIRDRAQRQLEVERARLEKQDIVPFERKLHRSLASKELTVWQGFRDSRAVARFKDSYFVATDGGLVELAASGDLLRHYSVLDGLPESDLLSLASLGTRLFIGTRTRGLVAFDGERFESYRWTDRAPHAITVLLEEANRLLTGTGSSEVRTYHSLIRRPCVLPTLRPGTQPQKGPRMTRTSSAWCSPSSGECSQRTDRRSMPCSFRYRDGSSRR